MNADFKTKYIVESKHGANYTGGDIQFSGDGQQLLCQCGDGLNLLEVSTGLLTRTIAQEDEEDAVSTFAISPNSELLVTAHKSLQVRLWDHAAGTIQKKWRSFHKSPISCCCFDMASTLLATGSTDSTIKVWDIKGHYITHNLKGHTGVVSIAKFRPDPKKLWLVTTGQDCSIRVWDLLAKESQCIAVLEGHNSAVTALCFGGESSILYSAGRDSVITAWDLENLTRKYVLPVFEALEGMVMIPANMGLSGCDDSEREDTHAVTVGEKGVLKIWNLDKKKFVQQTKTLARDDGEASAITTIIYSAATETIGIVTFDHNILLYNLRTMDLTKQFVGQLDEVLDLSYLGTNQTHLLAATNSSNLQVYRCDNWNCSLVPGHSDTVLTLDVCPVDGLCVTGSKDNSIRVWRWNEDEESLVCVATGEGHVNTVGTVAFSRTSSSFIVSGSSDQTIKLWELKPSNKQKTDLHWKLKCSITEKAHEKDVNCVAVAPNDKFIVSASQDRTAKLWRADGLSFMGTFRGHKRGIWSVEFSPIDQVVATASADGTIKIWAMSDYSCVKSFEGHDASVLKATFLTRGMQLLSSGSDGLMKLWDIKTSECVATFDEHEDKLWALVVSKDENQIITGAADSTMAIWKNVTQTEKEEERSKKELLITQQQELENLLLHKKYLKALVLAIRLEQPFRALNILKEIIQHPDSEALLTDTMKKLKDYQMGCLLNYCTIWNSNSRHCHVAQYVLRILLLIYTPEEILALPEAKQAVEALIPYTHRHFQRMNRLKQQAAFVEYTWQTMKVYGKED